jgi:hypothetical protein
MILLDGDADNLYVDFLNQIHNSLQWEIEPRSFGYDGTSALQPSKLKEF